MKKIQRRHLAAATVLLLAISAFAACSAGPGDTIDEAQAPPEVKTVRTGEPVAVSIPDRPNIVMVMADDMRADELGYAPTVRRVLQEHGVEFTNSFSPYPLCCPARASFLTGQYAHNHGVLWHQAPYGYGAFDDSATLATALSARGYRTGFIGKYLNAYGVMPSKVTGAPSHDYVPQGWTDWRATFENPGTLPGVTGGAYDYFDTPFNLNGRIASFTGRYQSNVIGDFSVDMAREFARGANPFFMYVNFVAPHFGAPVEPDDPGAVMDAQGRVIDRLHPEGLADAHGEKSLFLTPARPDWVKGKWDAKIDRPAGMSRDGGSAEKNVSDKPQKLRALPEPNAVELDAMTRLTRQRAESIFVMDQQIRRLVTALKASGEWEDTVLMFTSDNGYFLGEHRMRDGKLLPHEPSLRVPFLVTGPGLRSGDQRHDPISTVDVTASILELAGAKPPQPADGVSKVDTMLAGDRGWRVPVVTESMHTAKGHRPGMGKFGGIGLRTPRYSYNRYRNGDVELYDLLEDPLQNENHAGDAAYAKVERTLRRSWVRFKDCAGPRCRAAMPEELRADPQEEARISGNYWRTVRDVYAFR